MKKRATVDLNERIEVLRANCKRIESRLVACSIPDDMLAYADGLEAQATRIMRKASQIRRDLFTDSQRIPELWDEYCRIELEIRACEYARSAGLELTKGEIESLVSRYFQRKDSK